MKKKCLDDLHIGDQFTSAQKSLSAEDIKAFARDYDPQPFHLDEAAAQQSFFGGLSASGWHTASVTMRLMVDSMVIEGGLIGMGVEMHWPRPTRPGDTLYVVTEIIDIKPSQSKPDRGVVTVRVNTFNQHDECVQQMHCKILAFRRLCQDPFQS